VKKRVYFIIAAGLFVLAGICYSLVSASNRKDGDSGQSLINVRGGDTAGDGDASGINVNGSGINGSDASDGGISDDNANGRNASGGDTNGGNANNGNTNNDGTSAGAMTDVPQHGPRTQISVYVCGAVRNAGVYVFDDGARIVEGIEAAGGFLDTAAVDFLNLALRMSDEWRVYVPTISEVESGNIPYMDELAELVKNGNSKDDSAKDDNLKNGQTDDNQANGNQSKDDQLGDSSAKEIDGEGRININTASLTTLMLLKGIGEKKAENIISYREANGGFKKLEDLMKVNGISTAIFNSIADCITL